MLKSTTVPCQYWYNDQWYDLTDFGNDIDFFSSKHTDDNDLYAVWNFCQKISADSQASSAICDSSSATDAYATIVNSPSPMSCEAASTSEYSSIETTTVTYGSDDSETFGLKYSNPDNGCSLTVALICDDSVENYTSTKLKQDPDGTSGCEYTTTMTSAQVCPSFDLNALWDFMDQYSYIWGVLFIVGGIFLGFFGRKLFKAAIFTVTAIIVVFAILLLFYTTFLKSTTEVWVGWLVLCCSIIIGLVAGFFVMKLERLGAALLAGWGGFLLGVMINEMVLYLAESQAVFWSVSIGCAVAAAVLSFFFYEHVLILMTSFGGSYMLIRGISFYAGGFPNEFTLADQLKAGDTSAMNNWFYLYMVCILLVAVGASIFQYKTNKKEDNPYEKLK